MPLDTFTLAPGKSRQVSTTIEGRNIMGGRAPRGPWYIVAELHMGDTTIDVPAGQMTFDDGLDGIRFTATSGIEGFAPSSLVTKIWAHNHTTKTIHLEYGSCSIALHGFRTAERKGLPVFMSERSGMPATFMKRGNIGYACTLELRTRELAPGDSALFSRSMPTYEVIADTLPAGRYFFTATLDLNWRKIDMDAGSAVIPAHPDPLPKSRTIQDIRVSGSARRVKFPAGTGDSLDVRFTLQNTGTRVRRVLSDRSGNPGCVYIGGYPDRTTRDAYYLWPAYDAQWIARPCPISVPEVELNPGETRTFTNRIPASEKPLFYLFGYDFLVDNFLTRSAFADFAVDEVVIRE